MKKRIFGVLLGAAFLIAGAISFTSTENVDAAAAGGDWRYDNECSGKCDPVEDMCLVVPKKEK